MNELELAKRELVAVENKIGRIIADVRGVVDRALADRREELLEKIENLKKL